MEYIEDQDLKELLANWMCLIKCRKQGHKAMINIVCQDKNCSQKE